MLKCVFCGADTILLVSGEPVCVECDDKREKIPERKPPATEKPDKKINTA
jgi:hypothetical protein